MALNMNELMKEAQKMQQKMQAAQQELIQIEVTGEAGGGLVKVTMNGRHDVLKLYISPSLLEEDKEMVEDVVKAAFNDAKSKVEKISKDKITAITAGLPKDFQLPPEGGDA